MQEGYYVSKNELCCIWGTNCLMSQKITLFWLIYTVCYVKEKYHRMLGNSLPVFCDTISFLCWINFFTYSSIPFRVAIQKQSNTIIHLELVVFTWSMQVQYSLSFSSVLGLCQFPREISGSIIYKSWFVHIMWNVSHMQIYIATYRTHLET